MKVHLIKIPGLLILMLFFAAFGSKAQVPTYNQLISIISAKMPALNTGDNIIAFSAWSATNAMSRETNREFDRVAIIYQGAKLRNGNKGAVLVSYCVDDAATATIAFSRDNITYAIKVKKAEFAFLNGVTENSNVVYDNTAAKIYGDLKREEVFLSFNQLITR